jgi:Tol biopolymer transport system component
MDAHAAFPGDNGRVFFQRGRNIYSVAAGGGSDTVTLVAQSSAFGGSVLKDPAVSPNGKKIALSTGNGIWVGTIGGGAKKITKNPARNLDLSGLRFPAWSPDGRRLVFQANKPDGNVSWDAIIYRINVDGTGIKQLRKLPGYGGTCETNPDWGPTNRIVFSADDDLWVMKPDGSNRTNLTDDQENYDAPSWSPDGSMIAAEHEVPDVNISSQPGIVALDAATGQVALEVTGNAANSAPSTDYNTPSWSPNGEFIAFSGYTNGEVEDFQFDIYKISSDGLGEPVKLDTVTGDKDSLDPSWGVKP